MLAGVWYCQQSELLIDNGELIKPENPSYFMSEHTNPEQGESQSFHTKTWYGLMGFCIAGLCILGFASKDTSVYFYVMWAIILICFAPEINMMMAAYMKAIKTIELMKDEDRKRKAAEAKKQAAEEKEHQAFAE